MKRYGMVTCVKSGMLDEYKRLHAAIWPDALKMIQECSFTNYSIYVQKMPNGEHVLFGYLEYVGEDYEADCAKMAADKATQEWWAACTPCLEPLPGQRDGEWWTEMEEVYHSN